MGYRKNKSCKNCGKCGKEFVLNQHNQIYCYDCNHPISLKDLIYKCKICNNEYKPNSRTSQCCSSKCRRINERNNWNKWYRKHKGYEPKLEIECVVCGNKFIRTRIGQKICGNKKCKLKNSAKKGLENYHKDKEKILEKRRNNINFCILNKLRMRISCAVKSQGAYKADKTIKLVGCSVVELKQHLKKQFKEGMNWNNYGKGGWHIDHILPCAGFNLSDEEEQKKCFHYTNLQPMWAQENLIKNCKVF